MESPAERVIGRGVSSAPTNRFETLAVQPDYDQLDPAEWSSLGERKLPTRFFVDQTRSLIVENNSPDIPFRYSLNPYRGCEHGCAYCYARPYHEYLGLNAGIDFETQILVKPRAAEILRAELNRPAWTGRDVLAISGVTDCYQPIERQLQITRGIIAVLVEARQAFGVITKNRLLTRDLDLLGTAARDGLAQANISLTSLDAELCRVLEPRTSPPAKRLQAIRELSQAGVPVRVMVAPIIPGLNDIEVPAILCAAAEAGATSAAYVLLRLPYAVKDLFLEWVQTHRPQYLERITSHIRDTRGGQLNATGWGERMRGTGEYAKQIEQTVRVFMRKYGLDRPMPEWNLQAFRPPRTAAGQGTLF